MSYSTNNLNIQDAQRILSERQVEKASLEIRRNRLMNDQTTSSGTRAEREQELAETIAALDAITAEIANLPEGEQKRKKVIEQSKLVTDKLSLEERVNYSSAVTVTEREHDLAIILLKIAEKEVYITALQARITDINA